MHGVSPRSASRALATLAAIAAAVFAGACSKGEPQPSKQPAPRVSPAAPTASTAQPRDEVDAALKDRLARQEAAARMFERQVLEPPPPKAPEPPKESRPGAPPEPRVEPKVEAKPPAKPAPPSAPVAVAPKPVETPKPAPPPPARTEVAAVKPAPAPEPAGPRLVTRVDPEFPAEALRAGIEEGTVRARMTLDGGGNVTRVDLVEATPRRVFDRAVVRALSQWKYNAGAEGRTVDSEIAFRR